MWSMQVPLKNDGCATNTYISTSYHDQRTQGLKTPISRRQKFTLQNILAMWPQNTIILLARPPPTPPQSLTR